VEQKMFADISRSKNGGKGFGGVYKKTENYWNPIEEFLNIELKINRDVE
jgi:beta-lysine 5,6-aminomutase alpha subunit